MAYTLLGRLGEVSFFKKKENNERFQKGLYIWEDSR